MAISDWPRDERPREKLLLRGSHVLSNAELLAILLRSGVAGKSALDIARSALTQFGGLRALSQATLEQYCALHGLGEASYVQLQAALEIASRRLLERLEKGACMGSPQDTRRFLSARLRDLPHEVFTCLFLDNRHRVIRFEERFRGSIDGASVYPREVVKRALALNAAAAIFAHNHPSGVAEPSTADTRITQRLQAALALVDVRVLDHIVVGDGEPVSFAERGLL
ncbi:MAG: DNA repair protein RadC [Gammaproteobacteria bacterium]|nr:DNA repair protein RadC [Gammaproteobacteria bacterium]